MSVQNIKNPALSILALSFVLLAALPAVALASDPVISANAPKDKATQIASWERFEKAIAPLVAKARASYPQAKKRYLAGLPAGQSFFLTARLSDPSGRIEQVFIAVDSIHDGKVSGRIWSDVLQVRRYRRGDTFSFREADLIDWLITKPDGSEEGNLVGNFLDTYTGK
jgi:hypothetical protein